jgi:hypothetical protein
MPPNQHTFVGVCFCLVALSTAQLWGSVGGESSGVGSVGEGAANATVDEAIKRFNELDTDGSGQLSRSECAQLLPLLGIELTENALEAAMVQMDIAQTGTISRGEFESWFKLGGSAKEQASALREVISNTVSLLNRLNLLQYVLLPMITKWFYGIWTWLRHKINDTLYTQIRFRDPQSIEALREYFKHKSTDRYNDMDVLNNDASLAGEAEVLNETDQESTAAYDVRVPGAAPMSITHLPILSGSEYIIDSSKVSGATSAAHSWW